MRQNVVLDDDFPFLLCHISWVSDKRQSARPEHSERYVDCMNLHGYVSSTSSELISGDGALIPTLRETILICITLEFILVLVEY